MVEPWLNKDFEFLVDNPFARCQRS